MRRGTVVKSTLCLLAIWLAATGAAYASRVPTSARSRAVEARIAPLLARDMAEAGLRLGAPVFIRIFKEPLELELWCESADTFRLFRTYRIETYGGRGLGPKLRRGDGRAPEGFYYVTPERMNPASKFHLSFNLGYPNAYDRIHGRTGSALMVHGAEVSIGCFAMGDASIEEIFVATTAALNAGQPFFRVHVFPFRMGTERLARVSDSRWVAFWRNLKAGYDHFEQRRRPPDVVVREGRYVFREE